MSAVVVTIQVQLSVHSCYLIYSLSYSVDSETFSGRNQSIDCALAWVTIARDSESEHPFYPVRPFFRIRAGHLWCQIGSGLTDLSLNVGSGSYCTGGVVGSRARAY